MSLRSGIYMMLPLFLSFVIAMDHSGDAAHKRLRPAGVSGSFYPADPAALTSMMDGMLANASMPVLGGGIMAAVAPHAGYQYSGPVAAYTYAALKGHKYSRVVVIAPSHYEAFNFTSVYDGDGYVTPLGAVKIDKAFAQKLAKMSRSIQLAGQGHDVSTQGAEHAIEVQLPWLQHVLGSFLLVPIVMGEQSYSSSRDLGVALAKMIQTEENATEHSSAEADAQDTLIIASSDLSHYHTYSVAEEMDHKTLNALQSWDYFTMSRNFASRTWEACGGGPIVAAMIAAERLGANQAVALKYANSGDTAGDRSRVVGYSADVFVKAEKGKAAETPFSLSEKQKSRLLSVARKSVESAVRRQNNYAPESADDDSLNQDRGAFVTLRKKGVLRGCIGFTGAIEPLILTVRDAAAYAALRDPRFAPVSIAELPELEYEVSVLSPLRRVLDVQDIQVGTHGLLMVHGDREGLLLPQVPAEEHWDRTVFLRETCRKAGIDPNCWKDENTDIFAFTAVVFSDNQPAEQARPLD